MASPRFKLVWKHIALKPRLNALMQEVDGKNIVI